MLNAAQIEGRIKLLDEFRSKILAHFNGICDDRERERVERWINRNAIAAKNAVVEAGASHWVTIAPPASVGGMVAQNLDPFENLFESFWGISLLPSLASTLDKAIGVYEHVRNETGLVRLPTPHQVVELEGALERSLRPHFRDGPPTKEREVQDAVEDVLNVLGIDAHRDKEVAPVGPKAFRPDFTVSALIWRSRSNSRRRDMVPARSREN